MDEDTDRESAPPPRRQRPLNWRLIRKAEGLVFASLLLAVPLFAIRIIDTTYSALTVNNASVDLVRSLISARDLARDQHLKISVTGFKLPGKAGGFGYVVQNEAKTLYQLMLPEHTTLVGSVTFDETGLPESSSTFWITRGSRSVVVDIDAKGKASTQSM